MITRSSLKCRLLGAARGVNLSRTNWICHKAVGEICMYGFEVRVARRGMKC